MTGGDRTRRRVVVTGTGTVSRAGLGTDAFWADLLDPDERPIDQSPLDFDPSPWFAPNEGKRLDPYLWYSVAAADLAVTDAGQPTPDPTRAGVVMGNLYGAALSLEREATVLAEAGPAKVNPLLCAVACEDACASQLSIRHGYLGPSKLSVASCASGTVALADAAAMVAHGAADLVLAGAVLGPVTDVIRASYDNLRVTSRTNWSRPFDRRRDGFAFSVGAAVLVLESEDHALGRGARPQAEVLGWAQTNDAFHMSKPSGDGIERCMALALQHAGLRTDQVTYVNAHATGTPAGDREEAAAIARVFGEARPAITSIKGRTGHSLAASGAFEAVSVVHSLRRGLIPPSGPQLEIDPDVVGDIVHGPARPWDPAPVLSNSFGLGGHNATVVLGPYRP